MAKMMDDKKNCVTIFVVECSDAMVGSKMGMINCTIEEVISDLRAMSDFNSDVQILVKTMSFATGSKWVDKRPIPAEKYRLNYLEAGGKADLGSACLRLNKFLEEYFLKKEQFLRPIIFLISSGKSSDNFKYGCFVLSQNKIFQQAIKVAVAIGEDANFNILKEFTGSLKSVTTIFCSETFKKWIRFGELN